jgi:ATP-grasp domain
MQQRDGTSKRVLVVFPTAWDEKQLKVLPAPVTDRYQTELSSPADHDCAWNYDVLGFIEEQVRAHEGPDGRIDGVLSSSDYPGATVAGAIAARLGLPGTEPERVIRCSHKYYSRIEQREAAPEATPWFELVDPRLARGGLASERLSFPCFIKPVKGAFSVMSETIDSIEELDAFLARPSVAEFLSGYVHIFNQLVSTFTRLEADGSFFLLEGLLKGKQVTLEGFATENDVQVLGIVDSVRQQRTKSFVRFDYPSSLSRRVQTRMEDIAVRVIRRLGLRHTLFNIEMTYDLRRDRIFIVEVNPRMCGQFADLYEKVDGTNGYEVALALAVGERPVPRKGAGRYRCASSFPLRIFQPSRVVKAPSPEAIAAAEDLYPGTLVWPECEVNDTLDDFETLEDGKSARFGVVNLGAPDRESIQHRFEEVRRTLDYRFQPV